MSDQAKNPTEDRAETRLRQELTQLDVKRKTIEHEADAIYLELTTPPDEGIEPMGIDTPLVDQDGYPRADIDIYRTRTLRRRFCELKTDHKEITKKIESMLVQLAAMTVGRFKSECIDIIPCPTNLSFQNPCVKAEEQKELACRRAPKPKPKYDPVTGKWVVMNWDGTVAGIPDGDQRLFEDVDRQMSGLTGEDDVSSLGSSIMNSTRSITTADHEPRPPAAVLRDSTGELTKPFARVDAVAAESPAQQAGLKEEDLIINFGPIHADNHDHLKAIAELVTEAAAEKESLDISLLRRVADVENGDDEDKWQNLNLKITPRPWIGRGFLGCHIVPYSR